MSNNTTEKKWVSLPEFPIPARYDNAGAYLRALVQEKIGEEVKNGWSGVACRAQRLEEELAVLCQGFPENILIIKDFVDAARKAGHTVNANMDSACASQVLVTLGVTYASPMSNGLRFEDFANPKFAKDWLPTIGIRTTEEGRAFIINYLADKYGKEHVAVVGCDERKIVMSGEKIADVVPAKESEGGILITNCPMESILKSNLCLYTIDAVAVHPIERECLRETSGRLVYHEQLSEMLQLMSGLPYAWASWTQKCLATKNADSCATLNPTFQEKRENSGIAGVFSLFLESRVNEYFRTGHQQGFRNLADATDRLEEFIWNHHSHMNPALHVMVTHDINVGCFLAGRKVITQFDDSTWPHYLDSAVCFLDRYGRARYGFMRYYENKYTFDLK